MIVEIYVLLGAAIILAAVTVLITYAVKLLAAAAAAWTVAVGQAQQLSIVGADASAQVRMRRIADEPEPYEEQTRARSSLVDEFDERDLRAAARRPTEWNADDNARNGGATDVPFEESPLS